MNERYGAQRIKKSAIYFLMGKIVSAVAGLAAVVLTVRALSVAEFADYSILIALIELVTAISGIGITHAVVRYVPELYAQYYQVAWRTFLRWALALRITALLFVVVLAYLFATPLTALIGMKGAVITLQLFLVLVFFRVLSHFLSQILESCLLQGSAQLAFTLAAVVRVLGLFILLQSESITISHVIMVEALADLVAVLILSFSVYHLFDAHMHSDQLPSDDADWIKNRISKIIKFAINGYLQHLANLPNGGNANRLVGGHMLAIDSMASFGFSQSFYEYMKRYFPAQLLAGMIRPIILARYVESGDFAKAASLCSRVFQINFLLIACLISVLSVVGEPMVQLISNHKYGIDAVYLLVALLVVLIFETQRQQLDVLIQAVEKNSILIVTNIILSSSIFLSLMLVDRLGALVFPLASLFGLLIANFIAQIFLRKLDCYFIHDLNSTVKIVTIYVVSTSIGLLALSLGMYWLLAGAVVVLTYCILSICFYLTYVKYFFLDLTGKKMPNYFNFSFETNATEPNIAFAVLSCRKSSELIDQIARKVFPHKVYVHHDFSQQADFSPNEKNVIVMQETLQTGWGNWSLVEATLRIMKEVLKDPEITHFQLLSESCLPIRPISDFSAYIKLKNPVFMIDYLSFDDKRALYSHGWRYLTTKQFTRRILKRASIWVWGDKPIKIIQSSIQLSTSSSNRLFFGSCKRFVGQIILDLFYWLYIKKFSSLGFKEMALGGQWFGASREGIQSLLLMNKNLSSLTRFYQESHIPDESYFHSLIINIVADNNSNFVCVPSNHALFWHSAGTGPDVVKESDLTEIELSGKFFARKFPLESESILRKHFI